MFVKNFLACSECLLRIWKEQYWFPSFSGLISPGLWNMCCSLIPVVHQNLRNSVVSFAFFIKCKFVNTSPLRAKYSSWISLLWSCSLFMRDYFCQSLEQLSSSNCKCLNLSAKCSWWVERIYLVLSVTQPWPCLPALAYVQKLQFQTTKSFEEISICTFNARGLKK